MSNLPHPVVHAAQYEDIDPQKKEKTGMVSEDDSMQRSCTMEPMEM